MKRKQIISFLTALGVLVNPSIVMPFTSMAADADKEEENVVSDNTEVVEVDGSIIDAPEVELGENTITNSCGENTAWTYDLDSHTLVIGGEGAVISMTYLNDDWYAYAAEVEHIVVKNAITSLPNNIFSRCESIQSISMPMFENVGEGWTIRNLFKDYYYYYGSIKSLTITGGTTIPASFASSLSLEEVIITGSIETIGDNAFASNGSLTSVQLSDSVQKIGNYAFSSCTSLAEIELPSSLKSIGNYAFSNTSFTSFVVPDSVELIGAGILADNSTLESITLPFAGYTRECVDGTLASIVKNYYNTLPGSLTSVTITGGEKVADSFFYDAKNLTEINLPDTITEIGISSFKNCTALENIVIPSSVKKIGNEAFCNVGSASIEIPDSVVEIGNSSFYGCTALTEVKLSKNLQSIGSNAFYNCSSLESIKLSSSLKSIGGGAFAYTSLKSLVIPAKVESIGYGILSGVNTITSLTLPHANFPKPEGAYYEVALNDIVNNYYSNSGLPESLVTVKVTGGEKISNSFFSGATHLKNITLPDGLTEIGSYAFYNCSSIEKINIPDSVYKIGIGALSGSGWYEAQNNGVLYAGNNAVGYKGEVPANTKLEIKEGTLGIADNAFENISKIVSVSFPDTLVSIGSKSFNNCDGIEKVVIPDSVESIGSMAFANCDKLASVSVPDSISNVGNQPFANTIWFNNQSEGSIYVGKTFYGYKGTMKHNTQLVIREGTVAIADNALSGCIDLVSIELPESLESIGSGAFSGCESIISIEIPDNVSYIGSEAFKNCISLEDINIPTSLKTISSNTFRGCEELSSISIPSSVTRINDYAFYNCFNLVDVTIPDSITRVGEYTFGFDTSYEGEIIRKVSVAKGSQKVTNTMMSPFRNRAISVTLPAGLKSIEDNAFDSFIKVSSIKIPETVTKIGNSAFANSTIKSVVVPDDVTSIGSSAFYNCKNLKDVTLSESLTSIGSAAFAGCSELAKIDIPVGVTKIAGDSFSGCTNLISVILPDGLKQIDGSAFYNCTNLTDITIPDTLSSVYYNAFYTGYYNDEVPLQQLTLNISENSKTVTEAMTNAIKGRTYKVNIPESVTSIGTRAFSGFNKISEIEIPDTVATIAPYAFEGCSSLSDVKLPGSLEAIPEAAFRSCRSIREIEIPESVTSIGKEAFRECKSLQNIELSDNVTSIDSYTFYGCSALKEAKISDSMTYIPSGMFSNCSMLSSIEIPQSVERIGSYAFYDCVSLDNITLYDYITNIDSYAFSISDREYTANRCLTIGEGSVRISSDIISALSGSVTEIVIPDTITKIQDYAFESCRHLKNITIPDSVTTIGAYAFSNCVSLTELTFPEKLKKLNTGVCYHCENLETVNLPETVTSIPKNAFAYCYKLSTINTKSDDIKFKGDSFYGCSSLYDNRFLIVDKQYVNFFANTNSSTVDGLVNLTLQYKINKASIDSDTYDIVFTIPESASVVYNSASAYNTTEVSGNTVRMTSSNESDTINFSIKMKEYGNFKVSAGIEFYLDGTRCLEAMGTVEVNTPEISVSAPTNINNTSVAVKGFAIPGETVTIYCNDEEVGTAVANEKTGKYSTTVTVPEMEDNQIIAISASVKSGEETVRSNNVNVKYSSTLPFVESIAFNMQGHVDFTGGDITSVFTEGDRPTISVNPSRPAVFEIAVANSERVSNVYVTSTKGSEVKYLEAYYMPEEGIWKANGYFDEKSHYYVPGTLNVQMCLQDATIVNFDTGEISANQKTLDKIFNEPGTDKTNISELVDEHYFSQNVLDNTTSEAVFEGETAIMEDINLSNGVISENVLLYQECSDLFCIDGVFVDAETVAKNPGSYGFYKTNVYADENGIRYSCYVRPAYEEDAFLQVLNSVAANVSEEDLTDEQLAKIISFINAAGTYTLQVPEKITKTTTSSLLSANLKNGDDDDKPAIQDFSEKAYGAITFVTGNGEDFASAMTSGHKAAIGAYRTTRTAIKDCQALKDAGDSSFALAKKINVLNQRNNSYKSVRQGMKDLSNRTLPNGKTVGNLASGATKIAHTANTVAKFGDGAIALVEAGGRVMNASGNPKLQAEAAGIAAAKIGGIFLKEQIGTCCVQWGATAGAAIGGPVGALVGAGVGFLASLFICNAFDDLMDKWGDNLDDRIDAYNEGGQPRYLIDPSGYVFEAVEENRVEGATMSIYYKDTDTGDEILWESEDYDQQNPLTTDENGEYAWDVPEGIWRVKFELEGYETAYSEWMDVPPIRTDVHFSVVSLEKPEIESAVLVDGKVIVTFTKYMNVGSVTSKSLTLYSGSAAVSAKISATKSESNKSYAKEFILTPDDAAALKGELKVVTTDKCKSYADVASGAQIAKVEIPAEIISFTFDSDVYITAKGEEQEITITASPASVAAGKSVSVSDSENMIIMTEDAVFDENGKAVIKVMANRTGLTTINVSVEDTSLEKTVDFIAIEGGSIVIDDESSEVFVSADVNGDGTVNLKDVVIIRRYIAQGWNISINEKIADVNKDDSVTLKDVVLIRRYIAGGWNVAI